MKRRSQPPGFRFQPTHVELVMFYLKRKVTQKKLPRGVISELEIYKYAPWDLPGKSCMKSGDLKWYFFCPREKKYASGGRINRANEIGYWKSTGKDRAVSYNKKDVGQIKTLTFFRGKSPKGDQTGWVMHEYRLDEKNLPLENVAQNAYVLCVIFEKDGPGPRNGAQYGAPFKEEDWDYDGLEEVGSLEVDLSSDPSVLPSKEPPNSLAPNTSTTPSNNFGCPSASCISEYLASTSMETPQIASGSIVPVETPPNLDNGDDGFTLQDFFPEGFQATVAASNNTDQVDTTFDGLENIGGWSDALDGDGNADNSITGKAIYSDKMPFLELNDLNGPIGSAFEVTKYQDMQMPNFNAVYSHSNVIEQPRLPFSSFGAANQQLPCQYPSLPNFYDQIRHPTDLGYPDAHMSASKCHNSITGKAISSDQMPFLELNDLNGPMCSTFEVAKYQDMQMSNSDAAYSRSDVIEQPCFPFSSFGAANQHLPCQYPSPPNFYDQRRHPTDFGYPDAHMSASSSQSAWLQENIHLNSMEGCCNGYKAPGSYHDWNLP